MKKKILASDVDGTLVHYSQHLNTKDIDAIKKFRDAGHIFSLCTGRTLLWTIPLLKENSLHVDFLILCNGSQIYSVDKIDPLGIESMQSNWIPSHIGKDILKYFYHKKEYTVYWDTGNQTFEFIDRLMTRETSIVQERYSEHVSIDDLEKMSYDFVTIGISPFAATIESAMKVIEEIENKWGPNVSCARNQHFVDVGSPDSSKGTGIRYVQKHLGGECDIYGVGDSFNDVPMFQTVGKSHAFLMKNGENSLSTYADFQVSSVAECIDIILS